MAFYCPMNEIKFVNMKPALWIFVVAFLSELLFIYLFIYLVFLIQYSFIYLFIH